jgi:hypothetical protein
VVESPLTLGGGFTYKAFTKGRFLIDISYTMGNAIFSINAPAGSVQAGISSLAITGGYFF